MAVGTSVRFNFIRRELPLPLPLSCPSIPLHQSIDLTPAVTFSLLHFTTMDKLSGLASKFGGGGGSSSADPNQQAGDANNNEDYLDKGELWRTFIPFVLCTFTNTS